MANIIPKITNPIIHDLSFQENRLESVMLWISIWNDENSFVTVQTSGSTGVPKQINLEKRFILESAKLSAQFFHFDQKKHTALALSMDTIGAKMLVLRTLLHNIELIILPLEKNPIHKLDRDVDFISLVPMQVHAILEENPNKLMYIKQLLIGGAALEDETKRKLHELSVDFYESYGMTETYSHVALAHGKQQERIFHALPGIAFFEHEGKLVIHSELLGIDHLLTNDLVELVNSHSFKLLGRSDFAINSGGYKLHPTILENKLFSVIKMPFFISSEKDNELGEKVILVIEGAENETNREILKTAFQHLSKYEKPKKIYFINSFAYTPSGKINRLATLNILHGSKS